MYIIIYGITPVLIWHIMCVHYYIHIHKSITDTVILFFQIIKQMESTLIQLIATMLTNGVMGKY